MTLLIDIALFIFSLAVLIKGAGFVVDSAARIAKQLGISEFVIGLTIVAVGTSVPEYAIAIFSAFQSETELSLGNIVGANIANISLNLAIAATIVTVRINREIYSRDVLLLLAGTVVFFLAAADGKIAFIEGAFFVLVFFAYIAYLFVAKNRFQRKFHFADYAREAFGFSAIPSLKNTYSYSVFSPGLDYFAYKEKLKKIIYHSRKLFTLLSDISMDETRIVKYMLFQIVVFAVGLGMVFFGSGLLVGTAAKFPFSQTVFGLLFVAAGTTIPEMMVTIAAIRKGYESIMIGNIIGSGITNIFLIIGTAAVITSIPVSNAMVFFFLPYLVFVTWMFVVFLRNDYKINRIEGITLFLFYILLVLFLLFIPGIFSVQAGS